MKSKLPIPLISIGGVAFLILLLVWVHHSGTRTALESYRAGLLANGEKLSLTEIAIPPSTNPAHLAALQILGTSQVPIYPGMLVNLLAYVGPGKARLAFRGPLKLSSVVPTNAPAPTWEDFVRQTTQAEPLLKNLRRALDDSPPDFGWVWQDTYQCLTNRPAVTTFTRDRAIYQMLNNATIAELHSGNLDGAIANLHALAGLVQMNRNEIALGPQMVRDSICSGALAAVWQALQAPGWDEPRLASLQQDWEQVQLVDGLVRCAEAERAMEQVRMKALHNSSFQGSGDILTYLRLNIKGSRTNSGNFLARAWQSAWGNKLAPLGYKLMGTDADELLQLQFNSRHIELFRSLKSNRPWPEILAACTNLELELDAKIASEPFGGLTLPTTMAGNLLPNWSRQIMMIGWAETLRKLAITDIAIMRYQLKHATPPPDLAALTPEFLPVVPIDPMSGKPLCYRTKADGTFVLYSVGKDGKDDGGDASSPSGPGNFGLWEGRDVVWPSAAVVEKPAEGMAANERQ